MPAWQSGNIGVPNLTISPIAIPDKSAFAAALTEGFLFIAAPASLLRGSPCCFVAGTEVLTEDGYKNIEDIELGELVWAKNVETGEMGWKPVTHVFVEPIQAIYDISLIGEDGFEQHIEATDDHPFYVVGHGWKNTIELVVGDLIETDGYGVMTIQSVIDEQRMDVTYNFTVADYHTYYVTQRNVLVHNCGGSGITTAIGRMDDLKKFDLDVKFDSWRKSGRRPSNGEPAVTLPENRKWLQDRIDRGDKFILATDPASLPPLRGGYKANEPNGWFTTWELSVLNQQGIKPKYRP